MLSNSVWASSLMASYFSCVTVKILKDFRVMAVARERSRLVPLKAIPTGNPTPLANAAMLIPPVMTVDVIKLVSTIPVIVLKRFIFLAIRSRTSISLSKYASISVFVIYRIVVLVVPQGLNLDDFGFIFIYAHCLFNSCR